MEMFDQHKYRDVKFFLIAIAFISGFNFYLTYNHILFNTYFISLYIIDTIQGWLAWLAARSIIIWLDKKLPYANNPARRIIIQFLLTTSAGLCIIILLTELVSLIIKAETVPISFYSFDIVIISIWFFFINGIYIGMHYYSEWKKSEMHRQEDRKIRIDGFTVKHGKQNKIIPFADILGFYSEAGYSILITFENKKYFPDRSLDKIEQMLPQELFFRLNRQYILHRKALTGFKRMNDGKIDVLVNGSDSFPNNIQVSRTKAVGFKTWFQPELT